MLNNNYDLVAVRNMFEKFLIDNNCYSQFIEGVEFYHKHTDLLEFIKDCKAKQQPTAYEYIHTLVGAGFSWSGTPEGINYWLDISTRWKRYYFAHKEELPKAPEENFKSIW